MSVEQSTAPPVAPGNRPGVLARMRGTEIRNLGLVAVLAVLVVIGAATSENFLTGDNLENILVSSSVIGVVIVGATFVIIGGGIDLSVGAIVALASVWATTLATQSYGPWMMALCALLVGAGAGLINGLLIAYGKLVPFIVTLAMMVTARGLAARIADNRTQLVTEQPIKDLAKSDVLGIPLLVIILAVVAIAGWVLLNRTTFGRRVFAIGGNEEAARLAGIDVRLNTALLYVLSGSCCGIAAIMLLARTTTGSSTHGNLYELDAIAAIIIGGTLLSGGRGTIVGSILGVLVFTVITNIFILNNLATETQNIAKGLIIVAAVLLQRRANRS
ncbi:ABC transporter permease [Kineosporia succinea]|uniref:Ribose transport system permease protein n=1 Tax=Kineosporia succinea TaxID=84632 RepID=A0ABT9P580_9ACTN|nr:ABC transporter permease [Kineosporia succinea]MDP9827832.1 ribose transport system permease protein [Kineosporia succinea]